MSSVQQFLGWINSVDWTPDAVTAAGTIAIAFLTFVLALGTLFLWLATRRLVKGSESTAERQLRAYVSLNNMKYLSHLNPETKKVVWSIRPIWINSGATPTRDLSVNINLHIDDTVLPEDFNFPPGSENYTTPTILGPNLTIQGAEIYVTGEILSSVQVGKKHFFVWGFAKYNDVFSGTPERVTRFCHVVSVRGNPLKVFNDTTNAVEIIFTNYKEHNFADEECAQIGKRIAP
jgi:hypothetical protein